MKLLFQKDYNNYIHRSVVQMSTEEELNDFRRNQNRYIQL